MLDFILACDSSCTGLNQCCGPNATQCCSYNDDGNCVADCGMNREGNSTFHCVCSNFWTGDNCDGIIKYNVLNMYITCDLSIIRLLAIYLATVTDLKECS